MRLGNNNQCYNYDSDLNTPVNLYCELVECCKFKQEGMKEGYIHIGKNIGRNPTCYITLTLSCLHASHLHKQLTETQKQHTARKKYL